MNQADQAALEKAKSEHLSVFNEEDFESGFKAGLSHARSGEGVAWGNLAPNFKDKDRVLLTDQNAALEYSRNCFTLTKLFTHSQVAEQPLEVVSVPEGWKLVKYPVTEEMHVSACKVLHRATGNDGLPQRMLDAMLSAAPSPAVAQGGVALCIKCGHPTMHIGNICYGCCQTSRDRNPI